MDNVPLSIVIVEIIRHTPWWAWAILAAITALGLRQLRDFQVPAWRLLLAPLALGTYAVWSATAVFGIDAAAAWLAGALLALALNHKLRWPRDAMPLPNGRFALRGSPAPLLLMWSIFALRYALAVKLVFHPELARQTAWAIGAPLVYGTLSGLFAARAWRVLRSARTPAPALV